MEEKHVYKNAATTDELFSVSPLASSSHISLPNPDPVSQIPRTMPDILTNLSPYDTTILTGVLRSTPTKFTAINPHDIRKLVNTLPDSLLRPRGLISRILTRLSSTDRGVLCRLHKPLNPHLIHRLYLQICHECTVRISRFSEHPDLPLTISCFRDRMESINALWMVPTDFNRTFPTRERVTAPSFIESGCEACILSFIGGNKEILHDLRASMLGRKLKSRRRPGLLSVVEAWIRWLGLHEEVSVLDGSAVLGRELLGLRSQMQKSRRQLRRNVEDESCELWSELKKPVLEKFEREKRRSEGPEFQESESERSEVETLVNTKSISSMDYFGVEKVKEMDDDDADYDFESSIINDYVVRFSRCDVRSDEKDISPSFRDSVLWGKPLKKRPLMSTKKEGVEMENDVSSARERQLSSNGYTDSIYLDDRVSTTIGSWMDADPAELNEKRHEFL